VAQVPKPGTPTSMSLTWLLLLLKTIQVASQSVTGIEGVIISAATARR
jgi:hypothetical protein